MKNTMKRAHEIKRQAAKRWNCKTSEIMFGICLKMAWTEKKEKIEMSAAERMNEKIRDREAKFNGSDKQKKLANKIKKSMIEEFENGIHINKLGKTQARMEKKYTEISFDLVEIYETLKENFDSKFWIEDGQSAGKMIVLIKNQVYKMI